MASVTLTTLLSRVRTRADMVGSLFVTDSELTAFLNASLDELYDLVLQKFGDDYYVSSSSITTVAGTSSYALPSGFYKLLGVDLTIGGEVRDLKRFEFKERNLHRNSTGLVGPTDAPRYRLEGSNLRLYPAPQSVMSGTLWYVPQRTQLSSGSDTVDFPGGWEEYAVIDAAIKALVKEESDPAALIAAKADMLRRIEQAATNRDAGEPERVADVQVYDGFVWGDHR